MTLARRPLNKATTARLDSLTVELARVLDIRKSSEAQEELIKTEIREIYACYRLPVQKGHSEYFMATIGKSLRISQTEPKLEINAERARARFGDAVFLKGFTIKKAEIYPPGWEALLHDEVVHKHDLDDLIETKPAARAAISIERG